MSCTSCARKREMKENKRKTGLLVERVDGGWEEREGVGAG
jgi:hypothetical protein